MLAPRSVACRMAAPEPTVGASLFGIIATFQPGTWNSELTPTPPVLSKASERFADLRFSPTRSKSTSRLPLPGPADRARDAGRPQPPSPCSATPTPHRFPQRFTSARPSSRQHSGGRPSPSNPNLTFDAPPVASLTICKRFHPPSSNVESIAARLHLHCPATPLTAPPARSEPIWLRPRYSSSGETNASRDDSPGHANLGLSPNHPYIGPRSRRLLPSHQRRVPRRSRIRLALVLHRPPNPSRPSADKPVSSFPIGRSCQPTMTLPAPSSANNARAWLLNFLPPPTQHE